MSERPDLSPKELQKIIGEGINEHNEQRPIDDNGQHTEVSSQPYSTDNEPAHQNPVLAEAL